ncbi:unnamed protein product, partial [Mycena citricolor]
YKPSRPQTRCHLLPPILTNSRDPPTSMQFKSSIFIILASFVAASQQASCHMGSPAQPSLDQQSMHSCLTGYRTDNWDGMDCGGRTWYKGEMNGWKTPQTCYDACATCISEAIDNNVDEVQCDQWVGIIECWIGFN